MIWFLRNTKLWHFNAATFLATQILLGVEGWPGWALSAAVAWITTRNQPPGEKGYLLAVVVWCLFVYIAASQRHGWFG